MTCSLLKKCLNNLARQLSRAGVKVPATKPVSVRLMLEPLEDRSVPSLTPVYSTAFPWSAVVKLEITFPDTKQFWGSGVMVDSYHVLTAGHNIYDYADGGFASSIKVIPDQQGSYAPFGTAYMSYERTFQTWANYNKAHPNSTVPGDYDIGMLTLNQTIGYSTGSFGYGTNYDSYFNSRPSLNTAGYPAVAGYSGTQMYRSYGTIDGLSSDGSAIEYNQSNITTFAGQSGSPVWAYNSSTGQRTVYGIHVGGTGTANSENFATRITQYMFNTFQSWRSQDVPGQSRSVTYYIGPDGSISGHLGAIGFLQDAPVSQDAGNSDSAMKANLFAALLTGSQGTSPLTTNLNAQPEASGRLGMTFAAPSWEVVTTAPSGDMTHDPYQVPAIGALGQHQLFDSLDALWSGSDASSPADVTAA